MDVYIAPEVMDVLSLHPYVRDRAFRAQPIVDQLAKQALTLHAAHCGGDTRACMQLASWWPQAQRLTTDELMEVKLSASDAQLTIAREHGFGDWLGVEAIGQSELSEEFEAALDELLTGQIEVLEYRLKRRPSLVQQRSPFGHRATLLHYLGANGVESYRQMTPLSAPALAELLLQNGARLDATANMYGGRQTAYDLASTSAHPHHAGISVELNCVLQGS
ncbi:MAG: hypothetical protein AAFV47_14580 [Pseudomonadota bacterium]